jgi:hypothetical protein
MLRGHSRVRPRPGSAPCRIRWSLCKVRCGPFAFELVGAVMRSCASAGAIAASVPMGRIAGFNTRRIAVVPAARRRPRSRMSNRESGGAVRVSVKETIISLRAQNSCHLAQKSRARAHGRARCVSWEVGVHGAQMRTRERLTRCFATLVTQGFARGEHRLRGRGLWWLPTVSACR